MDAGVSAVKKFVSCGVFPIGGTVVSILAVRKINK